jgi:hypothetical protein
LLLEFENVAPFLRMLITGVNRFQAKRCANTGFVIESGLCAILLTAREIDAIGRR